MEETEEDDPTVKQNSFRVEEAPLALDSVMSIDDNTKRVDNVENKTQTSYSLAQV